MLSLSQTAGYAIQALSCLAENGDKPGYIKTVAQHSGVPSAYLAKIFKRLNDAGIVESKRGQTGGVWLARPPDSITLLEICNGVDGPGWMSTCMLGHSQCSDERACPSHEFWKKERQIIQKQLHDLTLANVVAFYRRQNRRNATNPRSSSRRRLVHGTHDGI